jgi:hypothetical protein
MKPFRETSAEELIAEGVLRELDANGYVLIRQLMPAEDIESLLCEMVQILSSNQWLLPGDSRIANPDAACGDSDPAFKQVYDKIFNLEAFHRLAHHPKLRNVMQMIVGPRLMVHPKPIGRIIFPNCDRFMIDAHQDHLAIGGDTACYTAWMPLHDCPVELGPLQILESSHHFGFQEADPATGHIPRKKTRGGDWAGGRINAGDVLIFHSLTVHSASPNTSTQMRVSLDCRFQDYARPLNPANVVFPGSKERSWEATYANWRSEDLKYFWKRLPLTFTPSKQELAKLMKTDESPRMRTRYSNILSQLEVQFPSESQATTNPERLRQPMPIAESSSST